MASVIPKSNRQRRHEQREAATVSTPDGTLGVGLHEVPDAIADAQRALNLSDRELARRSGITQRALRYVKKPTGYLQSQQRRPLARVLAYLESVIQGDEEA